jgi:SAM-dependent MidA family methyltransferase
MLHARSLALILCTLTMDGNNPLATALIQQIRQANGWIGFDAFMQQALYRPGLGYYAGQAEPFGARGDFVTAPMLGPWFAKAIWAWSAPLFQATGHRIREFGGGRGDLAAHLLALAGPGLEYEMVELSGVLRAAQQQATRAHPQVVWHDRLMPDFHGLVIANEVLDAMPVKRFEWQGRNQVIEWGVAHDASGFVWAPRPADPALANEVNARALAAQARGMPWPPGYRGEWCPALTPWLASLFDCMAAGAVLLIDYGFSRAELDQPGRTRGTLCAHRQHQRIDDDAALLAHVGQQDLTAHVNFSAAAQAGQTAGFGVAGFVTQGRFLLNAGVLELAQAMLANENKIEEKISLMQSLQTLITESEMGETFKVLLLTKGLPAAVEDELFQAGFASGDRIESVWA